LKKNSQRIVLSLLLTASIALAAAPRAAAQAPPGPLPAKPGSEIQKRPAGEKAQIRVRVALVTTPVTVHDSAGEMVLDLEQGDFRVFDNGAEQKIEHFDLGGDQLSFVLLFETSSRVQALLPAVRKSAIVFTQTVVGPNGEAAVLGFNDTVETLLPFSTDADQIEKSIERLPQGSSGARLYDGMSEAVGLLRNRPDNRRRVLVVIAEAADTGSEDKLGEVLREAQLSNITIYSVSLSSTAAELRGPAKSGAPPAITPPGTFPMPPQPGTPQTPTSEQQRYGNADLLAAAIWVVQHAANAVKENSLEVAAVATGGKNVSTFRDRSIEKAIDSIGGELHAQYTLSYKPTGDNPTGYHEIKVQVKKPGLKVRARPGYYLAPAGKSSN
jgi:VWFA-related protein